MLTPAQALEMQHEHLAFCQSRRGLHFWQSFHPNMTEVEALMIQRGETITLKTAQTYLVSEEMHGVALHAARSMPDAPIQREDLPSPSGFCLFAQRAVVPDVHNKPVSMAGFSWHLAGSPSGEGIFWIIYSDTTDQRDAYYHAGIEAPRLLPVGNQFEQFGKGIGFTPEEAAARQGGTVETVSEAVLHMRKLPLCLFALMQQTLVRTTEEKPQRTTRRRLAKAKSPLADKLVKVVRLRHVVHRDDEHTPESRHVDWTHRWIVNGHWRMQPTKTGVKRIYIMPFVKGPEGKPLVLKETVNVLER